MEVCTGGGKIFCIESGEIILDAALSAGVVLDHGCKTGCCGSCKAKVNEGLVLPVLNEVGLGQAERDDGWILAFARSAASDLYLDVDGLGDMELISLRTFPYRIHTGTPKFGCVAGDFAAPAESAAHLPPRTMDLCHRQR